MAEGALRLPSDRRHQEQAERRSGRSLARKLQFATDPVERCGEKAEDGEARDIDRGEVVSRREIDKLDQPGVERRLDPAVAPSPLAHFGELLSVVEARGRACDDAEHQIGEIDQPNENQGCGQGTEPRRGEMRDGGIEPGGSAEKAPEPVR